MFSRRTFLRTSLRASSLIALAPTVPAFLSQAARTAEPAHDGRILVVIQLDGGNDGINTVVPFNDEGYAKYRTALRLPPTGCTQSPRKLACIRRWPTPRSSWKAAGWPSYKGSATRTRRVLTSGP